MDDTEATETWRLLPFDRGTSAEHNARSDALVRLAKIPTVWWHATETPTLILGAGQPLTADTKRRCAELGVSLVRRASGGTAVFADPGIVGLDVSLPAQHRLVGTDVVKNYRWLGEVWMNTLRSLGVRARLVDVEESRQSSKLPGDLVAALRAACFGTLSPFEVVVKRRKVVGLAQVRRRTGLLLQSGIHLHFAREQLAQLIAPEPTGGLSDALANVAAGLDEILPVAPKEEQLMHAFSRELEADQRITLRESDWTPEEDAHVEHLVRVAS
ncbi:MAG TPA: ligase [Chloroflexi bacterium]|jgi:lipoate-protein ligase A|nr:ligase [Chloroflexota bacterium]